MIVKGVPQSGVGRSLRSVVESYGSRSDVAVACFEVTNSLSPDSLLVREHQVREAVRYANNCGIELSDVFGGIAFVRNGGTTMSSEGGLDLSVRVSSYEPSRHRIVVERTLTYSDPERKGWTVLAPHERALVERVIGISDKSGVPLQSFYNVRWSAVREFLPDFSRAGAFRGAMKRARGLAMELYFASLIGDVLNYTGVVDVRHAYRALNKDYNLDIDVLVAASSMKIAQMLVSLANISGVRVSIFSRRLADLVRTAEGCDDGASGAEAEQVLLRVA